MNDIVATDDYAAIVREIALAHAGQPGALLPLLHAIQSEIGYIPSSGVPIVAEILNLSRAEVHGVISLDHLFGSEMCIRDRN